MSDDATETVFKIPERAAAEQLEVGECGNCHATTLARDLVEGVCPDCISATAVALEASARPPTPEAFQLEVGQTDEVGLRRELRKAVQAAAVENPQGWLQHATEHVRQECVRGRNGHEFTIDTILDHLETARAPMPPQTVSMRFVMEHAIQRGWCEATDRTQPGRRDGETAGKPIRVYTSKL